MFELIRNSPLSFEVITEYVLELIRNSPDSFGGIIQLIRAFEPYILINILCFTL